MVRGKFQVALAFILLAAALGELPARPVLALDPPPQQPWIYLPVAIRMNPVFSGRVTDNGAPVEGQTLSLWYVTNNGMTKIEYGETTTAADGTYRFILTPDITGTNSFYVFWENQDYNQTKTWLYDFSCNPVTAANPDYLCDINIHDNVLLKPPDETYVSAFPVDFTWTPRNTTSDNYFWLLRDSVARDEFNNLVVVAALYNLGYTGSVRLNNVSSDLNAYPYHYFWEIDVLTPDGFGYGYDFYFISFHTFGPQSMMGAKSGPFSLPGLRFCIANLRGCIP
jgi:hypothetical protein